MTQLFSLPLVLNNMAEKQPDWSIKLLTPLADKSFLLNVILPSELSESTERGTL